MGSFAKWIGGGLGFVMGGPIGGLFGFMVGSLIDGATLQTTSTSSNVTTPGAFGMSLLVLIAAVMKADGTVVKTELDYVRKFFINTLATDTKYPCRCFKSDC